MNLSEYEELGRALANAGLIFESMTHPQGKSYVRERALDVPPEPPYAEVRNVEGKAESEPAMRHAPQRTHDQEKNYSPALKRNNQSPSPNQQIKPKAIPNNNNSSAKKEKAKNDFKSEFERIASENADFLNKSGMTDTQKRDWIISKMPTNHQEIKTEIIGTNIQKSGER